MRSRVLPAALLAIGIVACAPTTPLPSELSATPVVAAAPPTRSANLTATAPAAPPCQAIALAVSAGWQGATGSMAGQVAVVNVGWNACIVRGSPAVQILDRDGNVLPIAIRHAAADASPVAGRGDPRAGAVLEHARAAHAFFVWENWCGARGEQIGPFSIRVSVPGISGHVTGPVLGYGSGPQLTVPRCDVASAPSSIFVDNLLLTPPR